MLVDGEQVQGYIGDGEEYFYRHVLTSNVDASHTLSSVNAASLKPGIQHISPVLHHIIEFPAICEYPKA